MDLNKLNLVELNIQEAKQIEGGNRILKAIIGAIIGAFALGAYNGYKDAEQNDK